MNMQNFGILDGRLAKDPVVFNNKDGSRKIMVTIAVPRNYKNKDGKRDTDFIQAEQYMRADKVGNGAWDILKKGDSVSVEYTVRQNNYTDAKGETHYGQSLVIEQTNIRSTKNNANSVAAGAAAAEGTPATPAVDEEDAPFGA